MNFRTVFKKVSDYNGFRGGRHGIFACCKHAAPAGLQCHKDTKTQRSTESLRETSRLRAFVAFIAGPTSRGFSPE
ncbi:hypothetical protein [Desulfonema magnum]|uniref:Uncharacterized protein n=1 Tax=Desulfonema magnum TaxID=45655 RepID=A0A975BJA8_9BACT|nr:hypothetical protein [Desulfonema magnum]QTA86346.1 Uncharacterized protein dnm_023690 [Desulfonema magnum]